MNRQFLILLACVSLASCTGDTPNPVDGDSHEEHEEMPQGPHGGRLLANGNFQLELTVFEEGVPPEFRAYAYMDGAPLDPAAVRVQVELTRLGSGVERLDFSAQQDYLRSSGEVREPRSFVVRVEAHHEGKAHEWTYDSFEGRTNITAEAAEASAIAVEIAGAARIRETLILHGTVVPDPQRVYRLHARYPGVVKVVRKQIGERVAAGEVLAVIESNESLQRYDLLAPAAGVIVTRDANPGVAVADEPIMTVVDLSSVWVELASFQHDLSRIKPRQPVLIRDVDGHLSAEGSVESIAVVGSAASQSMTVRVVLANREDHWRPGLFVTGEVTVAETEVPLAVRRSALQTFRDWDVVFEQVGDTYEVRPLDLGRRDTDWIEVKAGLAPGARYVTGNSYLIKADIEKSGASHDH